MDLFTIITTLFACYFFFAFVNINILLYFSGFENDIIRQSFKEHIWLSDKLYDTYNSICDYRFTNKINWKWAVLVIFCPVFNIIWMFVTLHELYKFYVRNF